MLSMTKTKKISLFLLLLFTIAAIFGTFQFSHQEQTVGKVTEEKTIQSEKQVDEHGNTDKLTTQQVKLLILNHKYKGKEVTITNTYSYSQIKDHHYHKNEYVYIDVSNQGKELSGTLLELKRDHFLIILVSLLLFLLILIYDLSGILTFFSFILNGAILCLLFWWYKQINSHLLLLLFIAGIPLIVTLTLTVANGWNKKTKIAITSTVIGSAITFLIGFLVIELLAHKGLRYEEMELVTRPPHILFLSSLLIGCVGAVMDVSMTIISSLYELTQTKPNITKEEITETGKKIGEDIMGPMINIMFFSYLSGAIPLILIFLRNNMSFNYAFSIVLSLEVARALVGSIGIVLTIPLSIKLTTFFLRRGALNER